MSYLASGSLQLYALLVFLAVGFLLGLSFELFRFLRCLFAGEGRTAVAVQDVSFCLFAFLVLFFAFLAYADGVLRLHLLASAAVGILTFRLCVGGALRRLLGRLQGVLTRALNTLLHPLTVLSEKIAALLGAAKAASFRVLRAVFRQRSPKERKKLQKNEKRGLQNGKKSV